MPLTKTNFYDYSGYSATKVNDLAVDFFLTTFQESLEKELGYRFSLQPIAENEKFNYFPKNSSAQGFITVGAWQEIGLTVKTGGQDESETETLTVDPLVLGEDYLIFRFLTGLRRLPTGINKDNPVVGIQLLNDKLFGSHFIRLYGTWGFSNGLPQDLTFLIYSALKNAIEYNDSTTKSFETGGAGAGGGAIQKIKTYTTNVEYTLDTDATTYARNYFNDFLSMPHAQKVLFRYKIAFNQSIRTV